MVSAISLGWFADFGKSLTIIQCSSQTVPSSKWQAPGSNTGILLVWDSEFEHVLLKPKMKQRNHRNEA